jgi:nucleoside-diphosphate-sugar epimerase
MGDRQVVFGCNGPVGVELMGRLAAAGREVIGVCRSGRSEAPAGVRIEAADLRQAEAARRVAAGASVVYSCVGIPYPDWGAEWPGIVDGLLAAAESAGARLVFADNLYCYGPQDVPLTEDLPLTHYGRKPALRATLAKTLLGAHQAGRVRVALVRASDFYGPRVLNSALGERVFPRLLRGRPAQTLGDPDLQHAFTYVGDLARALVTLGEAGEDDYGRAWHVPNAPAPAQRHAALAIGKAAGQPGRIQPMPRWMLNTLALFVPILRELKEMMYQWDRPFEVDHSRFAARFWDDPTPLEQGLAETVGWYRSRSA